MRPTVLAAPTGLLDGPALAAALKVKPQTIRKWAADGLLTRRGKDARGRTLFDLDDGIRVSERPRSRRPSTINS